METNRVRQFCVVAETLNLRNASQLLNVTHSGLFKSIKVLESELGYALFQKHGRGIVLTERGKTFYPKAIEFLEHFDAFLHSNEKKSSEIRVGTFEVFSTYFFSQMIVPEFENEKFLIQELVPGELENALIKEKVDIGITYEPVPLQGLQILEAGRMPMAIFGRVSQFINHRFDELPFVVPALPIDSVITEVKGLDGWPNHKIARNQKYRVSLLETAIQLCTSGKAVGYFPKPLIALVNQTLPVAFRLGELKKPSGLGSFEKKVYVILRDGAKEDFVVKKITKCIRNFCKLRCES
ncbi:MAG: hypothetical protein COT74_12340 [Bdellovibrionales bacterium CG10_big_fil_rev_8_21_14_0_10_45_34]|nr:MAG: hypothetical protein COT74_12340 [Bdellovibrionales bacterium CG10_big_fil_rev_8_21_14_0_10_45_34]